MLPPQALPVPLCITQLQLNGCKPLEVMADIQFIRHANTAMQLDSLLADVAGGLVQAGLAFSVTLSGVYCIGGLPVQMTAFKQPVYCADPPAIGRVERYRSDHFQQFSLRGLNARCSAG